MRRFQRTGVVVGSRSKGGSEQVAGSKVPWGPRARVTAPFKLSTTRVPHALHLSPACDSALCCSRIRSAFESQTYRQVVRETTTAIALSSSPFSHLAPRDAEVQRLPACGLSALWVPPNTSWDRPFETPPAFLLFSLTLLHVFAELDTRMQATPAASASSSVSDASASGQGEDESRLSSSSPPRYSTSPFFRANTFSTLR